MNFPLFVKPTHEDASIGIDINSIVRDGSALKAKVTEIHQNIKDDALVEEYIEGREFFVSILGNNTIKPLPVVELDFSYWPIDKPKIYTHEAKVEVNSPEYKAIKNKVPDDLSGELRAKMQEIVMKAYRAIHGQDYARADIRIDQSGKIYILEINLNPYLGKDSETAFAARAAGIEYEALIIKIVELALARSKN
jgi:D-alanine-D-alanine ligase